jgi:small nuclear ribonucleoprotein (snRNP)-like protein
MHCNYLRSPPQQSWTMAHVTAADRRHANPTPSSTRNFERHSPLFAPATRRSKNSSTTATSTSSITTSQFSARESTHPPHNALLQVRAPHQAPAPSDVETSNPSTHSFFKTLVEHEITVELKNEVQIRGTLKSVDQYLNIKLDNAEAVDEMRWPHLVRSSSTYKTMCE